MADTDTTVTVDVTPYESTEHQVWVRSASGGLLAYRTGLIYSVARQWASAWNNNTPADLPGATFFVVKATTTYEVTQ